MAGSEVGSSNAYTPLKSGNVNPATNPIDHATTTTVPRRQNPLGPPRADAPLRPPCRARSPLRRALNTRPSLEGVDKRRLRRGSAEAMDQHSRLELGNQCNDDLRRFHTDIDVWPGELINRDARRGYPRGN